MDTGQAYNKWASQYDTDKNKTRDLEAKVLRAALKNIPFASVLEIGCGTGKNTVWFAERALQVTAIDLSEEMMALAKQKIKSNRVQFIKADINKPWNFGNTFYDLISFSLILEHIEHLGPIFRKTSRNLKPGGYVWIGELHPFKQYLGTKARFDTEEGKQVLSSFNHHISDFIKSAKRYGLFPEDIGEYFDDNIREIPRILSILLKKMS
jgi:ubiquinone/menaquinone biosynthesis C-methylase UbiE